MDKRTLHNMLLILAIVIGSTGILTSLAMYSH